MASKLELLKGCSLFQGLDRHALCDLAAMAVLRRLKRDEVLFDEGDAAEALFLLASGEVTLLKSSAEGRERFLRRVRPGEVFAEAAMFAGEDYPATALARGASEVISITRKDFLAYVSLHPAVSLAILGAMARLLRHLNGLLTELSLSSVEARLASWLLRRSRAVGSREFLLGIAKKELAFRLGTVPETLSRNLAKLSRGRVIRVAGERVTLRDVKRLHELAGL